MLDIKEVESLITLLEDDIWRFRLRAAEALALTKDSRAVQPLMKRLLTDEEWIVRCEAAASLAKLGDLKAIESLEKAVEDENLDVREASLKAVRNLIDGLDYGQKVTLFCGRCQCRFEADQILLSPLKRIFKDEGTSIIENVEITPPTNHTKFRVFCLKCPVIPPEGDPEKVILVLDSLLNRPFTYNAGIWFFNWFSRKTVFVFNEIWIVKANDFDIEEFVMRLRNDMDEQWRTKLRAVPVYLNPESDLSQAKQNLLRDTFHEIKPLTEDKCKLILKSIDAT